MVTAYLQLIMDKFSWKESSIVPRIECKSYVHPINVYPRTESINVFNLLSPLPPMKRKLYFSWNSVQYVPDMFNTIWFRRACWPLHILYCFQFQHVHYKLSYKNLTLSCLKRRWRCESAYLCWFHPLPPPQPPSIQFICIMIFPIWMLDYFKSFFSSWQNISDVLFHTESGLIRKQHLTDDVKQYNLFRLHGVWKSKE